MSRAAGGRSHGIVDAFRALYDERRPHYAAADASAHDLDGIVLAAAGIRLAPRREAHGDAVVADSRVAELHSIDATQLVPPGESAKTIAEAERLWRALTLERSSTLVAVGGGSTTDLAGFVAASYMRGIDWVAVPSTLVGQVDAAIGGKVGVDLPEGKNLVGAFHWPAETVIDTALLDTLPEEERRNGLAEVVKTGLLAGEPLWELDTVAQVRALCCLQGGGLHSRPLRAGRPGLAQPRPHVRARARGCIRVRRSARSRGRTRPPRCAAALGARGGGAAPSRTCSLRMPAEVDRDAAWAALQRDKKARRGEIHLVVLDAPGRPRVTSEVEPDRVRAALDALIA